VLRDLVLEVCYGAPGQWSEDAVWDMPVHRFWHTLGYVRHREYERRREGVEMLAALFGGGGR